ncbi:MAG: hypothetical protein IKP60_07510 [Treponema sp.]|nr:hypothetical protein [Treponema sp.]
MFCSKKVKVIAGIAFVLSQALSVFAADPFADYNVSEGDIANYFFYEEGSKIEVTNVDGNLTEVKTVTEADGIPYTEYRAFTNSDISMTYYPAAFSTAETKEGRLGLGSQLFAFTNNEADDFAYDSSWWTFSADGKSYLGTLAKLADEDPLTYAYVIFDVTDQENVKLYYKKTLSQSGTPLVGTVDGDTAFIVTQTGSLSPYVSEAYRFTDSGIEKQGNDFFAFDWSADSILASAKRTNPDEFNGYDYLEVIGTLKDEENHSYLFVYNRHPNRDITKVQNRLLVYYGQRLLGYYPTINQVPVIGNGEKVEETADAPNEDSAEETAPAEVEETTEETTAEEEETSILRFPKATEEEGNFVDFSKGIPKVIYVLDSAHVFKQF